MPWLVKQAWTWSVVFASTYAADFVWAKYMRAVADGSRARASANATLIILLGAVSVTAYVNDWVLVVPAMLGAAVGTWHSVGKR